MGIFYRGVDVSGCLVVREDVPLYYGRRTSPVNMKRKQF